MTTRAIPWQLAIPAEVHCEYAGTRQGDYYTNLESYLHTAREFPDLFARATGYRPPFELSCRHECLRRGGCCRR